MSFAELRRGTWGRSKVTGNHQTLQGPDGMIFTYSKTPLVVEESHFFEKIQIDWNTNFLKKSKWLPQIYGRNHFLKSGDSPNLIAK